MLSSAEWCRLYTFQQEIVRIETAMLTSMVKNNIDMIHQYCATLEYMQQEIKQMQNQDEGN